MPIKIHLLKIHLFITVPPFTQFSQEEKKEKQRDEENQAASQRNIFSD